MRLLLVIPPLLGLFFASYAVAQPSNLVTRAPQCPALTSDQVGAIDAAVGSVIAESLAAGVSLAVDLNGATLLRAYGQSDIEQATPVTEDTVFWVMSVNKSFTAASVMLLEERGLLELDDSLGKYLPAFPQGETVTIRQLLNHTSGIREFLAQPAERKALLEARMRSDPDRDVSELVEYIEGMVPDLFEFEPGTDWKYSNSNYILLGAVIEKVAGMPWQDFLDQNIFRPLNLRDTAVDSALEIVPHRARGYARTRTGFRNARDFPRNAAGPAGALRSTARDLLRWQLALMNGRVVSPEGVQTMSEPARLGDGRVVGSESAPTHDNPQMESYGLGLVLNREHGRRTIGQIGNFEGFEAVVQTYPDRGLTLAILTNTSGAATSLAPLVAEAILDHEPATGPEREDCVQSEGI